MGELRRYLKSNNVLMRCVSLILSMALFASALIYLGGENVETVAASEGTTKPYMEYIVRRLIDGVQEQFNVLEIVAYKGQGEFRYYASDDEVEEGLEANQEYLAGLYSSLGYTKDAEGKWNVQDTWDDIDILNNPFYNFKYKIKFDSRTNRFDVKGPDVLAKYVLPQYEDLIAEKLNVNTVEANDLTTADIVNADLIIINTGTHDNNTIKAYRKFSGDTEDLVFTKGGTKIPDEGLITYNSYEKVDSTYVPPIDPDDPIGTKGNIYIKNTANWSSVYAYYYSEDGTELGAAYPGNKMTAVEGGKNIYCLEIPSETVYIMFNNGSAIAPQSFQTKFAGFEKIYYGGEWLDYPLPEEESTEEESSTEASSGSEETTTVGESGSEETSTEEISTEETSTEETSTEETTTAGSGEGGTGEGGTGGETPDDGYMYISRDMSWNMCEKLLDYVMGGKVLDVPGGDPVFVKTPVVIDNAGIAGLSEDTNMYKMLLAYRMCSVNGANQPIRWEVLRENISITDASGKHYNNASGIPTPAIDLTGAGFTADAVTSWKVGTDNTIKKLFDRVCPSGVTAEGETLPAYNENDPFMSDYLTDDYWVYSGNKWNIPATSDGNIVASGSYFTSRIGDRANPKSKDVLRYLLGAKTVQTYSFKDKIRVLEIQPCNCFEYDTLEEIKELGRKLLRYNYENWESKSGIIDPDDITDYRNYITIDHVTPNALNSMTVDIASEYDLVIIGDNIGSSTDVNRLTQDANGTIYNDRNLNGYVYLAFGDLLKVSTYAMGYLPDEYIELKTTDTVPSGVKKVESTYKHVWTPYLYKELGKSTGSKNYVVKDLRDYYITKESVKEDSTDSDAIDNASFYLDHYLGNTRVSDNDITDITKEKLQEFVNTGNPIVVADSVYYADSKKLYPTSDMYDLAKNTLGATDASGRRTNRNVQRKETIGTCVAYLGTKAPRIDFVEGTVNYVERTVKADGTNQYTAKTATLPMKPVEPKYLDGIISTFNDRGLRYKFNVTGQVGKKYLVKLIIDKNNDGVYNDVDHGIADDRNEIYYSAELKLNQRTVTYEINSTLADNFIGMLAWKLEIVELNDAGNETDWRVSEKGYSAIRNTGNQPLKVLQIAPHTVGGGSNNLELNNTTFTDLMDKVEGVVGYDMSVDVIRVNDFVDKYNPNWTDPSDSTKKGVSYTKGQLGTANDKLNGYAMVVIGFADSYGSKDINNDYGALDNLLDYMDAGKAVLFTHDTVSWRSTPNYKSGYRDSSDVFQYISSGSIYDTLPSGDKPYGDGYEQTHYGDTCFNLTINFRDRVGMDRYGVTILPSIYDTDKTKDADVFRYDKEIPKYGIGCRIPSYMATSTNSEKITDASGNVLYYVAKEEIEVRELQGFNNWNCYRMNFCYRARSSYEIEEKGYQSLRPYADGTYYNGGNGYKSVLYTTNKIVQLNEGPITKYPYDVGTTVDIATTHGQYFELDMEDEDIVVWYSLDGSSGNSSKYYNRTYKDGGNNFYIYSKNNITYSGAGHASISMESELKLFVNTIIKAIAGGNSAPVVGVTNGGTVASGGCVVYVNSADTASEYEIDFIAEDRDLLSLETVSGNMDLVGEFTEAKIIWKKSASEEKVIKEFKPSSGNALKNGILNQFKLGSSNLTEDERDAIERAVETSRVGADFEIIVSDSTGMTASVAVQLQVRDLFEMD
ncbi:MAG: DUF5057 domain-containing protein [Lachnospiraceae bacterium]|nr:DUF5057 domain-containing protein [Lachnospiraceae bacterium]